MQTAPWRAIGTLGRSFHTACSQQPFLGLLGRASCCLSLLILCLPGCLPAVCGNAAVPAVLQCHAWPQVQGSGAVSSQDNTECSALRLLSCAVGRRQQQLILAFQRSRPSSKDETPHAGLGTLKNSLVWSIRQPEESQGLRCVVLSLTAQLMVEQFRVDPQLQAAWGQLTMHPTHLTQAAWGK